MSKPRGMERAPERISGRIVRLLVGQGYGYLRLASSSREVYFHRSDLADGTRFNDLAIGDVVTGQLVEDPISGARGVNLRRKS